MVEDSAPSGDRCGTDPNGTVAARQYVNRRLSVKLAVAGCLVGALTYLVYSQTAGSGFHWRYLFGLSVAGLLVGWRSSV